MSYLDNIFFGNEGYVSVWFNTLGPRQNGRRFADDSFKRILSNGNLIISIKISLKCVPKDPIINILALVQMMAWRRPGDKPLSEPMMVRFPTHPSEAIRRVSQNVVIIGSDNGFSLIRRLGIYIIIEIIWIHYQFWGTHFSELWMKIQ